MLGERPKRAGPVARWLRSGDPRNAPGKWETPALQVAGTVYVPAAASPVVAAPRRGRVAHASTTE